MVTVIRVPLERRVDAADGEGFLRMLHQLAAL